MRLDTAEVLTAKAHHFESVVLREFQPLLDDKIAVIPIQVMQQMPHRYSFVLGKHGSIGEWNGNGDQFSMGGCFLLMQYHLSIRKWK
jgi:hypothetical protein